MKYVFENTSLVNNPMLWIWGDTASYKNNITIALKSSHLAHFHEYEHDAFLTQMPIQTLEICLLIHSHSRACMSSSRVRQQLFNVYNNHFTFLFPFSMHNQINNSYHFLALFLVIKLSPTEPFPLTYNKGILTYVRILGSWTTFFMWATFWHQSDCAVTRHHATFKMSILTKELIL